MRAAAARTLAPDLLKLMGYQIAVRRAGRVADWIDPLSFIQSGSERIDEAALRPTEYEAGA